MPLEDVTNASPKPTAPSKPLTPAALFEVPTPSEPLPEVNSSPGFTISKLGSVLRFDNHRLSAVALGAINIAFALASFAPVSPTKYILWGALTWLIYGFFDSFISPRVPYEVLTPVDFAPAGQILADVANSAIALHDRIFRCTDAPAALATFVGLWISASLSSTMNGFQLAWLAANAAFVLPSLWYLGGESYCDLLRDLGLEKLKQAWHLVESPQLQFWGPVVIFLCWCKLSWANKVLTLAFIGLSYKTYFATDLASEAVLNKNVAEKFDGLAKDVKNFKRRASLSAKAFLACKSPFKSS